MSDILSLKFKFLFPRKFLFDQMVATMSMGEHLQTFTFFYFLLFHAFFLPTFTIYTFTFLPIYLYFFTK